MSQKMSHSKCQKISHSTKCQKNVSFKISNSIKCINVSCYMSQKMSYSKYLKIFQEMSHSIKCLMSLKMSYSKYLKKCLIQQNVKKMSHSTKCLKICLIQNVSKYVSLKMFKKCLNRFSLRSNLSGR